jgi:hypothetical protein
LPAAAASVKFRRQPPLFRQLSPMIAASQPIRITPPYFATFRHSCHAAFAFADRLSASYLARRFFAATPRLRRFSIAEDTPHYFRLTALLLATLIDCRRFLH